MDDEGIALDHESPGSRHVGRDGRGVVEAAHGIHRRHVVHSDVEEVREDNHDDGVAAQTADHVQASREQEAVVVVQMKRARDRQEAQIVYHRARCRQNRIDMASE